MTRAREAARLIGNNTFRLDSNNAVGFNSTTPDAMFDINAGLTVAGVITATSFSGTVPTITVADESSDTTCFPVFVTAATGNLAPKSGTNLTFNSSTGTLETTNVTVTGDLTVQGTTTTLDTDLIGVDKVEVGANNSTVGLAVTQSGSGAIIAAYDGASEVFRVDDGGNLGIGTDNPGVKLQITGTDPYIRLQDTADLSGYSQIMGTHQGAIAFSADTSDSVADSHLRFDVDGTERLRIDSSGRLLVSTTSSSSNIAGYGNGGIQLNSTTTAQACVNIIHRNNSGNTHAIVLAKARDGGANGGRVQDDDDFGAISFQGFDGTGGSTYRQGAEIRGAVDGTPGNTDMPGRLEFWTTPDGSATPTERLRITSAGQVIVNGTANLAHPNMDDIIVGDASGNRGITVASATNGFGTLAFGDSADGSGTDRYSGFVEYYHDDDTMRFGTGSTARLTISSEGADFSTTGALKVPVGTTAQRPTGAAGDFRYNSETGGFEGYTTEWGAIAGSGGGGITTTASAPSANTIVYLDLGAAQYHELALSAGITTISCSNGNVGESHVVVINQPSSGIATVGFDTYFEFPSGAVPSMSEGGSKVDMVSFVVKKAAGAGGTELLASAGLNYQ